MATATYKRGERCPVKYTAGGTIGQDDVVVCGTNGAVSLGVSAQDMVSGDEGIVDVGGIYQFTKVSAAVIKAGETVDWDTSTGSIDDNQLTAATGDVSDCGVAMEDAGNGVTTVEVLLTPGQGTLA
jgi:predicted RecA/RadA family phage recombinase